MWKLRVHLFPENPNRIKVYSQLKQILAVVADRLTTADEKWVVLERYEASISTVNGTKQIRHLDHFRPTACLEFYDHHQTITLEEWTAFAQHLTPILESMMESTCETIVYMNL